MGPPTDDPELLEQFDDNLEDADASASHMYESASRNFQEAREFLSLVKECQRPFSVVGIGAWLGQPLIENMQLLVAKARRKGKTSSHKGGKCPNLGTP